MGPELVWKTGSTIQTIAITAMCGVAKHNVFAVALSLSDVI